MVVNEHVKYRLLEMLFIVGKHRYTKHGAGRCNCYSVLSQIDHNEHNIMIGDW
jgi:hypothetical protein